MEVWTSRMEHIKEEVFRLRSDSTAVTQTEHEGINLSSIRFRVSLHVSCEDFSVLRGVDTV